MLSKLLLKYDYNKVGFNTSLEVKPSVVHFGGFSLHQEHQVSVRVVNVSAVSTRLHIIGPTTPAFRMKYNKKV